ncbi:hypothetical protein ACLGIH_20365 [Streptomyces sp. HMX87]|uniref:hypothetical protein n=1 Tax=Streptomyces sp. HMX87 TaxID=3390849 RepID=UPI003A84F08F
MSNRPMAYSTITAMQSANSRHVMGALAALAGENTAKKRRRMRGQQAARIAHANLRPAPGTLGETKRPCDIPVTFKAAKPERRRVVRAATSTAPEPVKAEPTPKYRPIKAAEVPAEIKAATRRRLADGGLTGEWLRVGILDGRDNLTVHVYARKHGASVRYSTGA